MKNIVNQILNLYTKINVNNHLTKKMMVIKNKVFRSKHYQTYPLQLDLATLSSISFNKLHKILLIICNKSIQ